MRAFSRRLASLVLASALALAAPVRLRAIVFGFVDTADTFASVGAFIVRVPSTGQIFPICSGTLIAPDVFLTAAHCTAFYEDVLAPRGITAHVSFDNPIPFGDLTTRRTRLIDVVQVVTNPAFRQAQSDPGDIAVLRLPEAATRGRAPAALPPAGFLDALAAKNGLKNAVFTPVGYGVQDRVVGGGVPFFQDLNPVPRMFAFSRFHALTDAWLRLSQNEATGDGGTCFGDSGGPNFYEAGGVRVIAAITITGDAVCRATNVTYRLDTPAARSFLAPFVALP
ncbi:MAG TPA: trypsin-like serine protease [Vicinamibacterales bacterium]|nr:trypsin-like serine protease [Vicinamibacterales bacterium]